MRFELALRGGGGEPVSFERTIHSHGLVTLPPNRQAANDLTLPRRLSDGSLTLATLRAGRAGFADVEVTDRRRSGTFAEAVQGKLRAVPRGDLRAFPTPQAMADAPESFYCERMKAGYRGAYLGTIAADVAAGRLDLEAFPGLPDDDLETALLALHGVGPYAAAHMLLLLGHTLRLLLYSSTRPKYYCGTFARTAVSPVLLFGFSLRATRSTRHQPECGGR